MIMKTEIQTLYNIDTYIPSILDKTTHKGKFINELWKYPILLALMCYVQ